MSKFNELLAQLNAEQDAQETLAKALPQESQDDQTIQAAAEEGDGKDPTDGEEEEEEEGDEPLTKSLKAIDGEGNEVEALDATELLKSLQMQLGEHDDVLLKALPQIITLVKGQNATIASQGELIKSLQSDMKTLAGTGKGRKTVLTITEKKQAGEETTLAKSQEQGVTPQEFMLKANTAFDKKIINGTQLTTIDVCLRNGQAIDPNLIRTVMSSN